MKQIMILLVKEMGHGPFGEKYCKEVRKLNQRSVIIELCGGTHVGNTSEIILRLSKKKGSDQEPSYLAVTGKEAFEATRNQEDAWKQPQKNLESPLT